MKHSETGGDIIEFPDGTQIADESGDSPCRLVYLSLYPLYDFACLCEFWSVLLSFSLLNTHCIFHCLCLSVSIEFPDESWYFPKLSAFVLVFFSLSFLSVCLSQCRCFYSFIFLCLFVYLSLLMKEGFSFHISFFLVENATYKNH